MTTRGPLRVQGWLVLTALAVLPLEGATAQQQEASDDHCLTCHRVLDDERLSAPARALSGDVHGVAGFGCSACHGGDPTAAGLAGMDPASGFVGRPDRGQIPQFCGRCHSDAQFMRRYNPAIRVDQVAEYAVSVHGRRLAQFDDPKVATCVSCHPAHSIKSPSDPLSSVHPLSVAETCGACHSDVEYMGSYDIPTNQLERYRNSIHWQMMSVEGDLSAPTCNDCHGNHGAAPPGISWVGNVCGQCHTVMADLFAESPHASILTMLGMPGCATCHGSHQIDQADDNMLGLGEEAVCARCHTAGAGGGLLAATMRTLIDSLASAYGEADSILQRAEHAGMEVSQAQFELNAARNALLKARTAIHSFTVDAVQREVSQGLEITATVHEGGLQALDDLSFRRMGLGVAVTIILVIIVGLVFKIRQIERKT